MSKIFYDHLIRFEKLEVFVNEASNTHEEKHELWEVIDKLIHNRIINKILHLLPRRHHEEFTELLHNRPFDRSIIKYLNETTDQNIEMHLRNEMELLEKEILDEILENEKEI